VAKRAAIVQPKFDPRISTLAMPLEDSKGGLKRGYMIWDKPIPGYSTKAVWHYLYNPSTIEARSAPQVTSWAPRSPIQRPNSPAIMAATSGRKTTRVLTTLSPSSD